MNVAAVVLMAIMAQPYWERWENIWPDDAQFGHNLYVQWIFRAPIRGASEFTELPDPDRDDLLLGDMIRGATCHYSLELIDGRRKWVEIASYKYETNLEIVIEMPGLYDMPFAIPIPQDSNLQELTIPDIPDGYAIDDIVMLIMGIPIPRRCIELVSSDGKNYSGFRVYQPYQWFDTNMMAVGVAKIVKATP
ncbi:MAG TPA: hypothetical protein PLX83_19285 [bacterium]|nr:hypothetical protein [bacterium]